MGQGSCSKIEREVVDLHALPTTERPAAGHTDITTAVRWIPVYGQPMGEQLGALGGCGDVPGERRGDLLGAQSGRRSWPSGAGSRPVRAKLVLVLVLVLVVNEPTTPRTTTMLAGNRGGGYPRLPGIPGWSMGIYHTH